MSAQVDLQSAQDALATRATRPPRPPSPPAPARCSARRATTTAMSSRSAGGPGVVSRRSHPPRLSRRRHRRARRARSSTRSRTAPSSTPGRAERQLRHRVHDRTPTGSSGSTATSPISSPRSSPGQPLTAGQPVGLVGQTGHAPARTSTSSSSPTRLSAGRAVVPVVRGDGLQLARTRCSRMPLLEPFSRSSGAPGPRRGAWTAPRPPAPVVYFTAWGLSPGRFVPRRVMGRLGTFVPRLVALTAVWLLATTALTYAAASARTPRRARLRSRRRRPPPRRRP